MPRSLDIVQPCTQAWDAMKPHEVGRFCDSCQKPVHDLSKMTADGAARLLDGEPACVRAKRDGQGGIHFADGRTGSTFRLVVGSALVAAAIVVPIEQVATQTEEDPRPLHPEWSVSVDVLKTRHARLKVDLDEREAGKVWLKQREDERRRTADDHRSEFRVGGNNHPKRGTVRLGQPVFVDDESGILRPKK